MRTYGTAQVVNGRWIIECEPQVSTRFKRIFEKVAKSSYSGRIEISDTPENCRELEWFMQRYPLEVRQAEHLEQRAREYDNQLSLVRSILAADYQPKAIEMAKPPYLEQLRAADIVMARKRLLCMDQIGAGKTVTALCVISYPEARPALVVTLTDLPTQWKEKVEEFVPGLRVHILRKGAPFGMRPGKGYGPHDLAALIDYGAPMPDIILTNYAKLAGWASWFAKAGIKSVTFDEIQDLRTGAGSGKYEAARQIARKVPYVLGLSATPIYNYGGEVYNVVTIAEPDAFGTRDEFIREWCSYANGKLIVTEPDTLGRYLREQGYAIRRTTKEVTGKDVDKPLTIPHKIEANLEVLDKMAADAAHLAKIIVAKDGYGNFEKFKAGGEFDWRLRRATGVAKAPYVAAFAKILLQSEERIVLFGWHHDVYAIYRETLKEYNPVFFTGKETPALRQLAKKKFCGGDARIMVISLRAGAGMDGLQEHSRVVLFGELDWSPRIHEQCVGRLARPGQKDTVAAYYPICDHGSDPVMIDALGVKNQMSHGILDPDAPLVEPLQASGASIKQLAESYLKQMQIKPEEAVA